MNSIAEIKRKKIQLIAYIFALINLMLISKRTDYKGLAFLIICVEIYALFTILINGCLSDALGKIIRGREAKGQRRSVRDIKKHSLVYQLILSILGMFLMLLFGSRIVAFFGGLKYSEILMLFFAPLLVLRTISDYLAGCIKGKGTELPDAIAVLLRQIFIFVFSVLFCGILGEYGAKVSSLLKQPDFEAMYNCAGVMIAILLTELFIIIFLVIINRTRFRETEEASKEGFKNRLSFMESVKMLMSYRLPLIMILFLCFLPFPFGYQLAMKAVTDSDRAVLEYGIFASGNIVLFGILVCLMMYPLYSIMFRMYQSLRKKENHYSRFIYHTGEHFVILITGYWVSFLMVMSEHLGTVLCKEYSTELKEMIVYSSSTVFTIVLSCFFIRVLLMRGKQLLIILCLVGYDAASLLYIFFMRNSVENIGVLLSQGIAVAFAVLCILLASVSYIGMRQSIDILQHLVIPIAVSSVSGLVELMIAKLISPHMSSFITLIVCFVISFGIYWTGILLLRNIRDRELEIMPFRRILEAAGQLLRVY